MSSAMVRCVPRRKKNELGAAVRNGARPGLRRRIKCGPNRDLARLRVPVTSCALNRTTTRCATELKPVRT